VEEHCCEHGQLKNGEDLKGKEMGEEMWEEMWEGWRGVFVGGGHRWVWLSKGSTVDTLGLQYLVGSNG
jgi:hypothetical protein